MLPVLVRRFHRIKKTNYPNGTVWFMMVSPCALEIFPGCHATILLLVKSYLETQKGMLILDLHKRHKHFYLVGMCQSRQGPGL